MELMNCRIKNFKRLQKLAAREGYVYLPNAIFVCWLTDKVAGFDLKVMFGKKILWMRSDDFQIIKGVCHGKKETVV